MPQQAVAILQAPTLYPRLWGVVNDVSWRKLAGKDRSQVFRIRSGLVHVVELVPLVP